jgi:hypothetical protein
VGLRRRLDRLEEAARPTLEDEREGLDSRESIRRTAEHANRCARGGWRPFEVTPDGDVLCAVDGKPVTTYRQTLAEEFYWMQMEWEALHLVRSVEPTLTLDEGGAFLAPDGRFALDRDLLDARGLHGPRTRELQEAVPPERWERFLAADERAAAAVERLLGLGEGADPPEGYATPLGGEPTREEADAFGGTRKPTALYEDAQERERVRRLVWALACDPEARRLLSELTRRRDAFAAAEGGGGLT